MPIANINAPVSVAYAQTAGGASSGTESNAYFSVDLWKGIDSDEATNLSQAKANLLGMGVLTNLPSSLLSFDGVDSVPAGYQTLTSAYYPYTSATDGYTADTIPHEKINFAYLGGQTAYVSATEENGGEEDLRALASADVSLPDVSGLASNIGAILGSYEGGEGGVDLSPYLSLIPASFDLGDTTIGQALAVLGSGFTIGQTATVGDDGVSYNTVDLSVGASGLALANSYLADSVSLGGALSLSKVAASFGVYKNDEGFSDLSSVSFDLGLDVSVFGLSVAVDVNFALDFDTSYTILDDDYFTDVSSKYTAFKETNDGFTAFFAKAGKYVPTAFFSSDTSVYTENISITSDFKKTLDDLATEYAGLSDAVKFELGDYFSASATDETYGDAFHKLYNQGLEAAGKVESTFEDKGSAITADNVEDVFGDVVKFADFNEGVTEQGGANALASLTSFLTDQTAALKTTNDANAALIETASASGATKENIDAMVSALSTTQSTTTDYASYAEGDSLASYSAQWDSLSVTNPTAGAKALGDYIAANVTSDSAYDDLKALSDDMASVTTVEGVSVAAALAVGKAEINASADATSAIEAILAAQTQTYLAKDKQAILDAASSDDLASLETTITSQVSELNGIEDNLLGSHAKYSEYSSYSLKELAAGIEDIK